MMSRREVRLIAGFALRIASATAAATGAAAQPLPPCATCVPPGPPVDPGASVRRDIPPAAFQIALDPEVAKATVTVVLGDATMNGLTLDYRRPAAPFSVTAGPCSMTGTLIMRIDDAPGLSAVYLDGVVSAPGDPSLCTTAAPAAAPTPPAAARAFRGDLVQWRSPISLVLLRDQHYLTANLAVQVDVVRGQVNAQAVNLSFFYGDELLWSAPVTINDVVTLNADVVAGGTTIRRGASFTLTVPSPVSQGVLTAQNLTIATGTTIVDASGVLSTWPAPPAGPPPGSSVPPLPMQFGAQ